MLKVSWFGMRRHIFLKKQSTKLGAQIRAVATPLAFMCGFTVCATNAASCEEETPPLKYPQVGQWTQDAEKSESLGPFLSGLGVPWFAVWLLDAAITTDIAIKFDGETLEIKDTTIFGTNTTIAKINAEEVEKPTRNGRKKFMLTAYGEDGPTLTLQCRLFQRGPGWFTKQRFFVCDDGLLQEQFVLQRPDRDDVVVTQVFRRVCSMAEDEDLQPGQVPSDPLSSPNTGLASTVILIGVAGLLGGFWYFKGSKCNVPPPGDSTTG